MEMINKTVRDRRPAGSQVATQQVLREIQGMVTDLKHQARNFKWQIVGGVIALVVLPDHWLGVCAPANPSLAVSQPWIWRGRGSQRGRHGQ